MDLLFPHYTQQQDRIAWIPEFEERHQFVTFLSELLEHPSTDPAHAGQVATVAHLLLQCARLRRPARCKPASCRKHLGAGPLVRRQLRQLKQVRQPASRTTRSQWC